MWNLAGWSWPYHWLGCNLALGLELISAASWDQQQAVMRMLHIDALNTAIAAHSKFHGSGV